MAYDNCVRKFASTYTFSKQADYICIRSERFMRIRLMLQNPDGRQWTRVEAHPSCV